MSDYIFSYFFIALFAFAIGRTIYYFVEKNKIVETYKLADTVELKNISGTIFTNEGTFKKKYEWCSFTLLINRNSLFIFPKDFYFIPSRSINIIFSNSDRKFTRHPIMLRKITVSKNSVELICYPDAISGSRRIQIQNLNKEQVSVFNKIRNNNNYH